MTKEKAQESAAPVHVDKRRTMRNKTTGCVVYETDGLLGHPDWELTDPPPPAKKDSEPVDESSGLSAKARAELDEENALMDAEEAEDDPNAEFKDGTEEDTASRRKRK